MRFVFFLAILKPCCAFGEVFYSNIRPQEDIPTAQTVLPNSIQKPIEVNELHSEKASTQMSSAELLRNPPLLKRAMKSVLIAHNVAQIELVLPIYKKLSDADPAMVAYANALLAHGKDDYRQAINNYRVVLSQRPELSAVRFDLAMALYRDRQFDAALTQFRKLQGENLPKQITTSINEGISAINSQDDWKFYISGFYQQNDNINSAPNESKIKFGNGTLTFPEQESAHGVHVDLGTSKRTNLSDHFYTTFRLNTNSDIYWDNHDYDDITLRASLVMGYQNANLMTELAPFAKKRFFGGESYSETLGANWSLSYQITPQWRVATLHELGREHFKTGKHLDGNRQSNSLSGIYSASSTQSWSAGINYFHNQALDAEDNYSIRGVHLGWGQEWSKGLSSKLTLSANQRKHEGVDFFNIRRQDESYSANISLWHRNWHWKGLTPRLVVGWGKTHSNHFYYNDKQDNNVHIEVSKGF